MNDGKKDCLSFPDSSVRISQDISSNILRKKIRLNSYVEQVTRYIIRH